MDEILEIPEIFLAFVFTLLVGSIENQNVNIETSIHNYIDIPYDNNKNMVVEFVEQVPIDFILPHLFNKNPDRYYAINYCNNGVRVRLTNDDTIQKNYISYLEHYINDEITFSSNKRPWSKYVADFEKEYLSDNYIRSNIVIDSIEYLPIIAINYFYGLIKIKKIDFNITGEKMLNGGQNSLYINNEEESELQFNSRFNNYEFTCTIDLNNYRQTSIAKREKPTRTQTVLEKIDKLVIKRGKLGTISIVELEDIVLQSGIKYTDKGRRIKNVVSDYRNKQATKLTLDVKDRENDFYQIIDIDDYNRNPVRD